jgi:hypothetical protein
MREPWRRKAVVRFMAGLGASLPRTHLQARQNVDIARWTADLRLLNALSSRARAGAAPDGAKLSFGGNLVPHAALVGIAILRRQSRGRPARGLKVEARHLLGCRREPRQAEQEEGRRASRSTAWGLLGPGRAARRGSLARPRLSTSRCSRPRAERVRCNHGLTLLPYRHDGPLSVRPALSGETPRSAELPRRAGLSRRRAFRHIGRSRSLPYAVARELEGSMIEAGVMGLAAVFAAVIVLAGSSRAVRGRRV